MKILSFSSLYPNALMPSHGIFVENRLRHLVADMGVQLRVVAPVPWFPFSHEKFGKYGTFAGVPRIEMRHGLEVSHPRYPLLPKLGMSLAPLGLFLSGKGELARQIKGGYDFDLIDAHYFYPDGVAAIMLGRHFNKPVSITARGTDINYIPRYRVPRRQILWAADRAQGLIAVCQALADRMTELGMDAGKISVIRNGVDLDQFQPDRAAAAAKATSRSSGRALELVSVGHLIPRKGHDFVIRALARLPGAKLTIAGDGPMRPALLRLVQEIGLADRVRFLGSVSQDRMPEVYGAADALVLASDREGWPNVLLESMACGVPVVAAAVWGIPEVVREPAAGVLFKERNADAIAEAVGRLMASPPCWEQTRAYAEGFSWTASSQAQADLFQRILGHADSNSSACGAERPAAEEHHKLSA